MHPIDLTGLKFGKLTVIERDLSCKSDTRWLCECECGNIVSASSKGLRCGQTKDCGCMRHETRSNLAKRTFYKHGESRTKLYGVWRELKRRCKNHNHPDFNLYGGRGITFCEEWNEFMSFYYWANKNGYKAGLTLDRIDVNGNYCPENCRWVDMKTQSNNRRNNVFLEYKGQKHTISEWGRISGIGERLIHCRIERGWSIERAIETKVRR